MKYKIFYHSQDGSLLVEDGFGEFYHGAELCPVVSFFTDQFLRVVTVNILNGGQYCHWVRLDGHKDEHWQEVVRRRNRVVRGAEQSDDVRTAPMDALHLVPGRLVRRQQQ